jgi:hypothetical protein
MSTRSLAESADNVRAPRLETGGTPGVLLDRGKTRVVESDITNPMRRINSAIVFLGLSRHLRLSRTCSDSWNGDGDVP